MNVSKLILPNMTLEPVSPENGTKFTETELDLLVGPARQVIPVAGAATPSFHLEEKPRVFYKREDYCVVVDANYLGEMNSLAWVLTNQDEPQICGTVLLTPKDSI